MFKVINQNKKHIPMEPKDDFDIHELREHLMVILDGEAERILIKVEDETFPVHRSLLSLYSPVFAAMFRYDTVENREKQVFIHDSSEKVIGEMIKFIYTGKTSDLCPSLAIELYAVADKYSISQLRTLCCNFLASSLAEECVLDVLVLASQYGDEKLTEKCMHFLIENASIILQKEEFLMFLKLESEVARSIVAYLINQIKFK